MNEIAEVNPNVFLILTGGEPLFDTGVPDTTPEFTSESALVAYLSTTVARTRP